MLTRRSFKRLSWATGAGHAALTDSIGDINGKIVRVNVTLSSVTDNPTANVSITDARGATLISASSLADGTAHVLLAESHKATQDAGFNPVPCVAETLTVSVDPSADAGGEAQTLTADVDLYLEQ
jgi:hypothetical protein